MRSKIFVSLKRSRSHSKVQLQKTSITEGFAMDGEIFQVLSFADDVVIVAENQQTLQTILNELDISANSIGLKIS